MEAPANPCCAPLPTALAGSDRVAAGDDLARGVEGEDLQDLGLIAEEIDRRLEPGLSSSPGGPSETSKERGSRRSLAARRT